MGMVSLTMDGQTITASDADTVLEAARSAGIYIPALCNHPDLPPGKGKKPAPAVYQGQTKLETTRRDDLTGCGLCMVEVAGEADPLPACLTAVAPGMSVVTDSPALKRARQAKLALILARHPHACLTCAQAEGCSRSQCSSNVPPEERCCPRLGNCELQEVAGFIGISPDTPRWIAERQPVLEAEPLIIRDYALCIGCTRCVRACEDLRGVGALGWVWDAEGRVRVGSLAPTLADSGCRFCAACVEVCPTGAIMDKIPGPGGRAAGLAPCREACPAGIDVPEYLRLIAEGKPQEALATVRERIPLPGVLGRVCQHPCQEACRRGQLNQPVAICLLKRYAADHGGTAWRDKLPRAAATGRRVAVVGSGPAGLTAAFFLARKGHAVTIFEAEERPGGMLRHGIPAYRLPEAVLAAEIQDILDMGVELKTGGKVQSVAELKAQGHDAVFLAVGAQLARRIPLEGDGRNNVLWGLDFLKAIRRGEAPRLNGRAVVVGGGNVALDAALCALRQGARSVDLICLEKRGEMPALAGEVRRAEAEGVKVRDCWGPVAVAADGKVSFRRCLRVFDEHGLFNPAYDDGETLELAADWVILAVGQDADLSLAQGSGVAVDKGLIAVDPKTLATGEDGVFAGGDATAMPGSVVQAVADGRRAAASIDRYLGGDGDLDLALTEHEAPDPRLGRVEGFAALELAPPARRAPQESRADYDEVCLGYSAEQARAEAGRCLQCQLRSQLSAPPEPPRPWLAVTRENLALAPRAEGVLILFDDDHNILAIQGAADLRAALAERLEGGSQAAYFAYEEDPLYSKAEAERMQAYAQAHGCLPPGDGSQGGDDLDDLF